MEDGGDVGAEVASDEMCDNGGVFVGAGQVVLEAPVGADGHVGWGEAPEGLEELETAEDWGLEEEVVDELEESEDLK